MVFHFSMLIATIFVLAQTASSQPNAARTRTKRILYGQSIGKYDYSEALGYYVVMRDIVEQRFECFHWILQKQKTLPFNKLVCPYKVQSPSIRCGGTLLTTKAVMTSCTCIADFWFLPNTAGQNKTMRPRPIHPWERIFEIVHASDIPYHNLTNVCESSGQALSYVVHAKCESFGPWSVVFNIGLVFTQNPIDKTVAPLFLGKNVKTHWIKVALKEIVCLYIGYGKMAYKSSTFAAVTPSLHHAFRVTGSTSWCLEMMRFHKDTDLQLTDEHANSYGTSCSVPLGKYRNTTPSYEDQGYPVTCSKKVFGVQGLMIPPEASPYQFLAFSAPYYSFFYSNTLDDDAFRKHLDTVRTHGRPSAMSYANNLQVTWTILLVPMIRIAFNCCFLS